MKAYMYYFSGFLLGSSMALVSMFAIPAHALERVAGGTLEQEANWGALKAVNDSTNSRLEAMQTAVAACNKIYKLYAPGGAGADGQGCIANTPVDQLKSDVSTIQGQMSDVYNNKIKDLYNRTTDLYNRSGAGISCANQGLVWNGGGCVAPRSSAANCHLASAIRASGQCGNNSGPIPGNAVLVSSVYVSCGSHGDNSGSRETYAWVVCQ